MDFYVISPVSDLEPMKMGDRIFALAHLWVKYPHYRTFILNSREEGYWITLDNSAAERSLVTEDTLIDICHELMPDEVIVPDVLFDCHTTLRNALSFKSRMEREGLKDRVDIFFCPQGDDKHSWLHSYMWALEQDWINTIGFSKISVPRCWLEDFKDDQGIKEARHRCYDWLGERDLLMKPIHCLGQGDPTEFAYYADPMMRSTDSVFPILAASHGQNFEVDHTTRIPTPHDFLETYDMSQIDMDIVKSNVEFLRQSCQKDFF